MLRHLFAHRRTLSLFCKNFLEDLRVQLDIDAFVLKLKFFEPTDQTDIHTAKLAAPFVILHTAQAVFKIVMMALSLYLEVSMKSLSAQLGLEILLLHDAF